MTEIGAEANHSPEDTQLDSHSGHHALQTAVWVTLIAAVLYGVYQVVKYQWVCDDAFISFRYAKNLVNGLGLVFNAGERVEGYTNFLWTMIVAAGMLVKLDPVPLSEWLGGIAFFGTVSLFGYLSYRLFRDQASGARFILPLTSIALLLHRDSQIFATSGLETSFVTALVSGGFALLLLVERNRSYLAAGLVLVAAVLTRPDALPFYAVSFIYILATRRPIVRPVLCYLAPLVLIYLPYWLIRYHYYGYPFPNTYYAKSAYLPYYSEGALYLWLYLEANYVLILAPLAATALVILRRKFLIKFPITDSRDSALLLALLSAGPYLLYVLRSGGDFMFARFLIPVTPIMFFLIELGLRTFAPRVRQFVPITVVVLALVILRYDPFPKEKLIGYVADEHAYYPAWRLERAQEVGGKMKQWFAGTDTRVAFLGMFAMYVYYSEVPLAIERATGLTDEFVAHQTLTTRGRPGHEKEAPISYLQSRHVNFLFQSEVHPKRLMDSLMFISFDNIPAFVLMFDNQLMDHLKKYPEIGFTDVRSFLDTLIVRSPGASPPWMEKTYPFFKEYYFDHNSDTLRQNWFLRGSIK